MPDDPEVSLRQYIEKIICEYRLSHDREHVLIADSQAAFAAVIEAKIANMVHLKEDISRTRAEAASCVPRSEYSIQHKAVEKELSTLKGLVYIGLGLVLAIQFFIGVAVEWGMKR